MKRIAITGGPGGGKDTALSGSVEQWIKEWGLTPIILPEIASLVIKTGFSPPDLLSRNRKHYVALERAIIKTQIDLYREIEELAKTVGNESSLVLFENRGLIDAKSYLESDEFRSIISKELGISEIECRDGLYDAVFHFRTVADVMPDLYMKLYRNNPARYENTREKAVEADERTLRAWLGHPYQRVIPNITLDGRILSFEEKLEIFKQELKHTLGIGGSYEIEKKFRLCDPIDLVKFPVPHAKVAILQTYLDKKAGGGRIRQRTQDGSSVYYITQKKKTGEVEVRKENEFRITKSGYESLMRFADPKYLTISKDRIYFVWKNQSFELDLFMAPKDVAGSAILELELSHRDQKWGIPPWLGAYEDVTGIKEYSNKELARIR